LFTSSNIVDPVSTNNGASAVIDVQRADLAVSKVVNNPTPGAGSPITYTVISNQLGVSQCHQRPGVRSAFHELDVQ
jgi:hypothetical protein